MGGGERPRWGCDCKVLSAKRLLVIVIRCSGLERRGAMVKRGKLRTELGGEPSNASGTEREKM